MTDFNLAFYTCFYGSDSNLAFRIPYLPSSIYKCYYYTNNKSMIEQLKNTEWIGVYDDKPTNDDLIESSMAGKHIKAMPHEYVELKEYDYLCFLDNKLEEINETFIETFIVKYFLTQNYALLLRQHIFIKDTVWNEYNESIKQPRYKLESDKYKKYIKTQIENGLSENTNQHCQTGLLIRNMKHEKMKEINTTWYQHIQECGIECQISFFFIKQLINDTIYAFTENPFV